ncbi:MAG: GNAT family N-acetyltransferase [Bacteroidales bacterium]
MRIHRYGITLRRLEEGDLETVRQARNAMTKYMEYQEYITPGMQEEWFESVNNLNNFYYIIEKKNEKIGLINIKGIERQKGNESITMAKSDETGIFMFDEKYFDTLYPIIASIILIEVGFYIFPAQITYARVMKTNQKAIDYNLNLGYKLCEGQENVMNQKYYLTKENFDKKAGKLRKIIKRLTKSDDILTLVIEDTDYKNEVGQYLEDVNNKLGLSYYFDSNGYKVYKIDLKDKK